jgi:hypothetical protein
MPNVFDTNDIRTTGFTVEGVAVISGNSQNNILEVIGESGTNLVVTDDSESNLLWGITGDTGAVTDFFQDSVSVYKDLNITGDTSIDGAFAATSKSFDIVHPTKEGYRLRYGVLEGPEHAVYHRGKTKSNLITLPEYWTTLVDTETTSVHLTPIGNNNHWVESIDENSVKINSNTGYINCFYIIYAERKDINKITIEYNNL